jgi:hypothetical protein
LTPTIPKAMLGYTFIVPANAKTTSNMLAKFPKSPKVYSHSCTLYDEPNISGYEVLEILTI